MMGSRNEERVLETRTSKRCSGLFIEKTGKGRTKARKPTNGDKQPKGGYVMLQSMQMSDEARSKEPIRECCFMIRFRVEFH